MTPIDDLKKNDLIALVAYRGEEERDGWLGTPRRIRFDGKPLKVLAVSLPFLAVSDGCQRLALDVRDWDVQRVSKEYAEALEPMRDQSPFPSAPHALLAQPSEKLVKKRKKKAKPHPNDCPRCACRMRKRLTAGKPGWFLVCPQCHYEREE